MKKYFVTAIGTDSGKTIISAIVTEALNSDYWKPVQSGIVEKDSNVINKLISNQKTKIHAERYLFNTPVSPHWAAEIDGINVELKDFEIPNTENDLVIEGAGGLLVPINNEGKLVADLIEKFNAEIIFVSNNYLGSINHTLLTINEIKRRGLKVKGIVFNGPRNENSENYILKYSGYKCLLKVGQELEFDKNTISNYAEKLLLNWN